MEYFVLYNQGAEVKAVTIPASSNVPSAFVFEGRRFEKLDVYLGDFNHLIGENRELVGFEFPFATAFKELFQSSLIKQSTNVKIDDAGTLQIILCAGKPFHSDEVLGIGNWIYHDRQSGYIVVVPEITEWGNLWSKIAFAVKSDSFPIPA